jgi:hypothetical protein
MLPALVIAAVTEGGNGIHELFAGLVKKFRVILSLP